MNCLVSAGPTFEPLDEVRRLTNSSTGRLGTHLANSLVAQGHHVTLLIGAQATWPGKRQAQRVEIFTTTASLEARLAALASQEVNAVFPAAAVSDFAFGKIWARSAAGELTELRAGKLSTRHGPLLAELRPTPKVIGRLRDWFPLARIVGWKFEVDGDGETALAKAREQIQQNRTDACVANGPAWGPGFALVSLEAPAVRVADRDSLCSALSCWLAS